MVMNLESWNPITTAVFTVVKVDITAARLFVALVGVNQNLHLDMEQIGDGIRKFIIRQGSI